MKNVKTKIRLKIQKENLERLESYVKQNNLRFASFVREAIEDYLKIPQEKRGVKWWLIMDFQWKRYLIITSI